MSARSSDVAAASLSSDRETSAEARDTGESHFSQKSAARRQTGAHRSARLLLGRVWASVLNILSPCLPFGLIPENAKLIDVYVFLFDEFLLITKIKRNKKVCRRVVVVALTGLEGSEAIFIGNTLTFYSMGRVP